MSDTFDQSATDLPLSESLDQFATRLLVEGAGGQLAADLERWSERAAASVSPQLARLAAELAETAHTAGEGAEDCLRAGIARLQQELAAETQPTSPPVPNSLAQDPELIGDFILESREHLASIESQVLVLEQNPADLEAIHSVFRGFHTIKGLAGFLDLPVIQEVAHEVESLLDQARNGKLALTPAVVDVVLEGADYLKNAVSAVEASLTGKVPPPVAAHQDLVARIHRAAAGESVAAEGPDETAAAPQPTSSASQSPQGNKAAGTFSVRVETGKLDYLMDMVGEMVIAQSLIRHNPALGSIRDARLQADLAQLARSTGEVQRTAMGMRMIPIGQLFQRTARLVRDLARKLGRPVELETRGEETELDKTIAEELADPLLHMVRNSIDHGIEPPEVRAAAGKNPTARVRLAAYHQGGQIVVEIADDGRGLDREKILAKARERGLIEPGAQLSENEIFHLIFEPGFSTADRITDISGRGVGMDVVRRQVQKLRGRIEVQSKAGEGSAFFLKVPLTLAIIEGLVVMVGVHRYIVPIFAVREMFRLAPGAVSGIPGGEEMVLVRGCLLPLVRLYRRFGVQPRSEDPYESLLVVAECEGKQFCLLVDELAGKQEVVIKSLGESLKNIPGIAGGAILGDGRVGLILDVDGVFRGDRRE